MLKPVDAKTWAWIRREEGLGYLVPSLERLKASGANAIGVKTPMGHDYVRLNPDPANLTKEEYEKALEELLTYPEITDEYWDGNLWAFSEGKGVRVEGEWYPLIELPEDDLWFGLLDEDEEELEGHGGRVSILILPRTVRIEIPKELRKKLGGKKEVVHLKYYPGFPVALLQYQRAYPGYEVDVVRRWIPTACREEEFIREVENLLEEYSPEFGWEDLAALALTSRSVYLPGYLQYTFLEFIGRRYEFPEPDERFVYLS